MPPRARIDAPGALQHVICRGIERRKILWQDSDRDDFLKRLEAILGETQTPCYAWALMPNHFHLSHSPALSQNLRPIFGRAGYDY
jgi:putative transposase